MRQSKFHLSVDPDISVEVSDQAELPGYHEWALNMPDWLTKIQSLIDCRHIAQAQELLIEEEIQ